MALKTTGIKFTPRKIFDARFKATSSMALRRVEDALIEQVRDQGVDSMKRAIRKAGLVKTGTMLNSVQAFEKRKASGELDRRYSIDVIVQAPYADFVDRGTRASPGRFVPDTRFGHPEGYRIKTGIHPGVPATRFSAQAAKNLQLQTGKLIDNFYVKPLTRAFKLSSGGAFD